MTTVKLNKSFVVNRKISCILILALVIISINNLCIRQVECQLEPIGAVLTVVPVTSILATAGLHALKLQALSHLLKMFGYDQSYVAKASGKGTAENPIGYQENLNYLLPYVPMLNISVKEEHLTPEEVREMDKQAVKTHPAMMLPGDYESIKSYRDVDIEGILRKAGIKRQPQIIQVVKNQPQGNQYGYESQEVASHNAPSQQQQKAVSMIWRHMKCIFVIET